MPARSTLPIISLLALASGVLACERMQVSASSDSARHSATTTAASASVEEAKTELRKAVEAFAARNLYGRWSPDPTDGGKDPVCHDPDEQGNALYSAWGIARARVLRVSLDDSAGSRASASVGVVRLLHIVSDLEVPDSEGTGDDIMFAVPIVDTMDARFRRRPDGRWIHCALFSHDIARGGDHVLHPISLIGPPADTLAPRGTKLIRIFPEGTSWRRLREAAAKLAAQPSRVRITRDSLGGQPLWIPTAEVLRRWPGAARGGWGGYEIGYPAVRFTAGELQVWAVQTNEVPNDRDSVASLDLEKSPDFYAIEGRSGELLGLGVNTGSPWRRLLRALGAINVYQSEGGRPVTAIPCRFPGFVFGFSGRHGIRPGRRQRQAGRDGSLPDIILPDSARLDYVHINSPEDAATITRFRCGQSTSPSTR